MTNWEINQLQKQLEETMKTTNPDDEFGQAITKRYNELEKLKS